jgi:hypothetical protein
VVDDPVEREEARAVLARIPGIQSIHDDLTISDRSIPFVYGKWITSMHPHVPDWLGAVAGAPVGSDNAIERKIKQRLGWTPVLAPQQVNVNVEHGRARLTGEATTLQQLEAASEAAYLGGAASVDNQMSIR